MKVRFEFEIAPYDTQDLEARDFDGCESIDDLHMQLLDQPNPSWRVFVNKDDLQALWTEIQNSRQAAKDRSHG